MCFKDFRGVADRDRDDRAFCLGCDLEASFMEFKKVGAVGISVSGPFRENTDGDSRFYLVDRSQDRF